MARLSTATGHVVKLARDEMIGKWGYPQFKSQLDTVLEHLPHGTLAEQSVALYRAAEAAKGVDEGLYRANRMALGIVRRAEYIEMNREQGNTDLDGITKDGASTGLSGYLERAYQHAAELSEGHRRTVLDARVGIASTQVAYYPTVRRNRGGAIVSSAEAAEQPVVAPAKPKGLLSQALHEVLDGQPTEYKQQVLNTVRNAMQAEINGVKNSYPMMISALQQEAASLLQQGSLAMAKKDFATVERVGQVRPVLLAAADVLQRHHDLRISRGDKITSGNLTSATPEPAAAVGAPASTVNDIPQATGSAAPASSGSKSWTAIDKQIQYDLEVLGYPTGQSKPFDSKAGVEVMDGKNGKVTGPSIAKFLAEQKLGEALTPEAITKLRGLAQAKLDGQQASQAATVTPAVADPAPVSIPTAAREAAAKAMSATASKDQNDTNYRGYVNSVADVGNLFREHLGLQLSAEQLNQVTLTDGVIASPDILKLEKALNAVRGDAPALAEDGKWDPRLTAIAGTTGVNAFIGAVFSGAASAADSQTPPTSGQGAPASRAR